MWQQIFLGFIGFCAGAMVAGGVTGLVIGLSIIPRYAGNTHTGKHILLYEDVLFLGTLLGNMLYVFSWHVPLGTPFLCIYGLFSGFFLGGWVMALAEMADIFPIFSRRLKLTKGFPFIICFLALGKTLGSLLYYYNQWGSL